MSRQPLPTQPDVTQVASAASWPGAPTGVAASTHEAWVDVVRLAAAFLVVVAHVLNVEDRLQYLPVHSAGWIAADALNAGIRWALPIFVMVSGYFLLDPGKNLNWDTYYRRRMQRIGWPLLAWTVLYLGLTIRQRLAAGTPIDPATLAERVIRGDPYYHLWYIYMLPGLYAIGPFIRLATDRMSRGQLIAAVGMCFAIDAFSSLLDAVYLVPRVSFIVDFPHYLGYFLAGHLLGRVLPTPRFASAAATLAVSIVATAALAYVVADLLSRSRAGQFFGFWNPLVVVLSLSAFTVLRQISIAARWRAWLARAGEASFGIYLVHPAILDTWFSWIYPRSLPAFAIEVTVVFLSSFLVILTMQRIPGLRRCV